MRNIVRTRARAARSRRSSRPLRWLVLAGILPIVAAAFGAAELAWYVYADRREMPDIEAFLDFTPPTTGAVYDSNGELLVELAREYRQVVDFENIPPVLRDAVLAAEDKNFFSHSGIDYGVWPRVALRNFRVFAGAFRRAWLEDAGLRVDFIQGGSTITQQLVRNHFLQHLTRRENDAELLDTGPLARASALVIGTSATNKLFRKAQEMRLALWLEEELAERLGSRHAAKEAIFARYASLVYLGQGRYGFAAASRHYFGKDLADYGADDADEAALLAAIIKSPGYYSPTAANIGRSLRRRNDTLALMARNGWLSDEQSLRSQSEPILLATREPLRDDAPAAVAHVLDELRDGAGGFAVEDLVLGRVRAHATVDVRIQRIADEALENGLAAYEKRHPGYQGETQGAVVVLRNEDASILAEVGGRRVFNGRDRRYTDFNRAVQALRQPGSALKPLVYLAAFRSGATLDTTVLDDPIAVPGRREGAWKPIANYDGTFKGAITIRQAIAESRNAATVWTAREFGIDPVLDTARRLGMHSKLRPYLSTALGASEVTLLDLANVYRTIASSTVAEPHVVATLTDQDGNVVHRAREMGRRLHMPELSLIQEGLRGVVRLPGGTGRALAGRDFPLQVIGKTGTSNDFRDALFVGSTYGASGITVAVWVGRDDHKPLGSKESGGRTALPIFREIMLNVYAQSLVDPAPQLPRAIDRHIDDYLAEDALLVAAHAGNAFAPAVDRWAEPARNPIAAARDGSRAVAGFVRSWWDRLPVVGRGNTGAPPPPARRAPPARAPHATWTCSQTPRGIDCVRHGATQRIAVPNRPTARAYAAPRL